MTGAAGLAAGMLLSGGGLGKLVGSGAKVGASGRGGRAGLFRPGSSTSRPSSRRAPPRTVRRRRAKTRSFRRQQAAYEQRGTGQDSGARHDRRRQGRWPASTPRSKQADLQAARGHAAVGRRKGLRVRPAGDAPLDIDAIVASRRYARARGSEIYAASLVAMTPDRCRGRAGLSRGRWPIKLASLPAGLVDRDPSRQAGQRGARPRCLRPPRPT
jgi:hypothetical protein